MQKKDAFSLTLESSKPVLLFPVVCMLLLFIMAARTPMDTDLWWHLRAGEATWLAGKPVLSDLFSFTRAGEAWVNHSWLGQVFLFLAFQWLGYWGLSLLVALVVTGSFGILFLMCKSPLAIRSFVIIFGAVVSAPLWTPRPQIFSLLFFALVLKILNEYKHKNRKTIWILPPIFLLWSNIHAGFTLGLMLAGAMIIGEAMNRLLGREGDSIFSWRKMGILSGCLAVCAGVVLLGPNGVNTWLVQFHTIGVEALQKYVTEWASPDFHDIAQQPFLWLLLASVLAFALSEERPDGSHLMVWIWFVSVALMARRNIGVFALVAIPALDRYGWPSAKKLANRLPFLRVLLNSGQTGDLAAEGCFSHSRVLLHKKIVNLSLVAILMAVAILKLYVVAHPLFVNAQLPRFFPSQAVDRLTTLQAKGNLLNEYNWGGYLIWFSRQTPVYIDGRTDLYGDHVIHRWIDLIQAKGDWEEELKRRDVKYVLLQPDRPILERLQTRGWKTLYRDCQAVLLQRE